MDETIHPRPLADAPMDVIVIDLDGTLLGPDGSVAPANVDAIRRAEARGIEVIIATGRAYPECVRALEALDWPSTVIAAGGSLRHAGCGRTVTRRTLALEVTEHAVDALLDGEHRALLLKDGHVCGYDYLAVGDAPYDAATEWWFRTWDVRVRTVTTLADDADPGHTVRVGAVAPSHRLAPVAAALEASLAGSADLQHWSAVTEDGNTRDATHLLELFAPGVNKWTMVEAHCRERGIDPRRTAAIGDGLNDVELIRDCGVGVAMGNADPRVLAVADHVSRDHASAGVAHAIDCLLDGTWT